MHGREVFRRVLALRRIAATDVTAIKAQTQMHPRRTRPQTLLAPLRSARQRISRPLDVLAFQGRRHAFKVALSAMGTARNARLKGHVSLARVAKR
jgi:hypothetical protein